MAFLFFWCNVEFVFGSVCHCVDFALDNLAEISLKRLLLSFVGAAIPGELKHGKVADPKFEQKKLNFFFTTRIKIDSQLNVFITLTFIVPDVLVLAVSKALIAKSALVFTDRLTNCKLDLARSVALETPLSIMCNPP